MHLRKNVFGQVHVLQRITIHAVKALINQVLMEIVGIIYVTTVKWLNSQHPS